MRFVIVTGMSGAGKSSVLKMLEDAGYFCVDNLPVPLILKFAEISWHEENMMSKVALGIDIRSRNHLNMLGDVLKLSLIHIYCNEITAGFQKSSQRSRCDTLA